MHNLHFGKKCINFAPAIRESPKAFSPNNFQMLNKAIMYAKLAWVYAKGMCGLRRRVYDLQFVYVPEDKLWYIDMPWPGDRYNLAMVAGSNHLLTFLDYKGERRVRVLVKPSKNVRPELESEGYFMCDKQFSSLLGGATYKVTHLNGFTREIWICPVTLTVLGHYPKYIYIRQINVDGSTIDAEVRKNYVELMNAKFVDMNVSIRLMNVMEKLHITTLKDLMYATEDDVMREYPLKAREELYDLVEALDLPWGTKEKREASFNKAAEIDRQWCYALGYANLEDDLKLWKQAEADYKKDPDQFDDLTMYSETGIPFYQTKYHTYIIPNRNYDNFLDDISYGDIMDYTDLSLFEIHVLLDARKFVKRRKQTEVREDEKIKMD